MVQQREPAAWEAPIGEPWEPPPTERDYSELEHEAAERERKYQAALREHVMATYRKALEYWDCYRKDKLDVQSLLVAYDIARTLYINHKESIDQPEILEQLLAEIEPVCWLRWPRPPRRFGWRGPILE